MTRNNETLLVKKLTKKQFAFPFVNDAVQKGQERHFFHSSANESALQILDLWRSAIEKAQVKKTQAAVAPLTPEYGVLLTGPKASGKSFLLQMQARLLKVPIIRGGHLSDYLTTDTPTEMPQAGIILIDDAHMASPQTLFRLINKCLRTGTFFALTGAGEPMDWAIALHDNTNEGLIDLETRISALPRATLLKPDVDLMAQTLVDVLAQRQIRIASALAVEAAEGLKRDFYHLLQFADLIDAEALERQKKIDSAMIQTVLRENREIGIK